MKQILSYSGPLDFVALRHILATVVLFAVLWLSGHSLRPPPLIHTALIGIFQTAGFQGLVQWALLYGGTGRVVFLAYIMPFWVVLLAWWLLQERPALHHWIGLALAAVGLISFIEPWHLDNVPSTLLATAGGASWAIATVLTKRFFRVHAPDLLGFTAWQMLIGSTVLVAAVGFVSQREIDWTWQYVGGLLYNGILSSGFAWFLWTVALKHLSATVISVSTLGVPLMAILMAWFLLGEQLSSAEVVGVIFITLGIVSVSVLPYISWKK